VRISLPLMLTVSIALHVGVATGIALSCLHVAVAPALASSEAPSTTLVLLTSEETPDFHQPVLVKSAEAQPVAASAPVALPSPPQLVPKPVSAPTAPPPASLALEVNPNAHVRALPPESVLCPNPAPNLNGHDGVVFLLDISGSMYEACAGSTRLAMARDILAQRIRDLKEGTPFAITVYAQTARNSGPLVAATNATREAAIRFIREEIDCGGGTDLPAGLTSAMKLEAGNLVLVSDGDLNTTLANLIDKARSILNPQNHGPALTVVGISPRPNTDAVPLLKSLASLTGGTYLSEQPDEQTALLTPSKDSFTTP